MKTNYFRVEKYLLKLCGVSLIGNESISYKIYSFFVLTCFIMLYPIIQSGDIFKHDFIDRATVFLYVVGASMGAVMTLSVLINRIKLGKLFDKLEEAPFLPNTKRGGDKEERLLEEWAVNANKQRVVLYLLAGISITSSFGYTLLQRIINSDPLKWKFGFGQLTILNVTYSPNYEICWMYQNISEVAIIIPITTVIIILSNALAFASVQFKILQNNLRTLVECSYQKALQDSDTCNAGEACASVNDTIIDFDLLLPPWKYLRLTLKESVSHHLEILELISELQEIFSITMFALYLSDLVILGCMMYVSFLVRDFHSMVLVAEAGVGCVVVVLVCYWGEQVADESQNVGLAAYEANFVATDLKFQKALIIIMQRSQNPNRIKAGYLIETSLVTLVWIFRTSYSCFMFLNNTK